MQDNLFFDPGITRTIPDQSGQLFYTDGKRGLMVEQDGTWLSYTDPVASMEGDNNLIDNVMASISFVNEHGGWNGKHQFVKESDSETGGDVIRFQQYYRDVPIVSGSAMNFGFMQLTMRQGEVASYYRSLVDLGKEVSNKSNRQLPGGDTLRSILNRMDSNGKNIEALFPAFRPTFGEDVVTLNPVWVARLFSGEVVIVSESSPILLK
jgi:regulatory protein YycH of two-component signal transduction system YycFG